MEIQWKSSKLVTVMAGNRLRHVPLRLDAEGQLYRGGLEVSSAICGIEMNNFGDFWVKKLLKHRGTMEKTCRFAWF